MEFKLQKRPKNESIRIAKIISERIPLLIDYSDKYTYNQVKQQDEITYYGNTPGGLTYDSGIFYIGSSMSDYKITDENVIITTKKGIDDVSLYYQYQLKFDVIHPENIKLFNSDDEEIYKYIEYGYVGSSPSLLSYNVETDFDTLDGHTDIGELTDGLFASINDLKDDIEDVYNNLGFTIYGDCLAGGTVTYADDVILEDGTIEFYFAFRKTPDTTLELIEGSTWSIYVDNSLNLNGSFPVVLNKWYRLKLDFSNNTLVLRSDIYNSGTQTVPGAVLVENEEFTINGENAYVFDMGIFNDGTYVKGWDEPLYSHRYSKSLVWTADKPEGVDRYRVRLLLPDGGEYRVHYDGKDSNDVVYRNKTELVSQRLIYKKYSNTTVNDWFYDGVGKIYFVEHAYDDLSSLMSEIGIDNIEIYTKPTSKSLVNVSIENNKIFVQSGTFKSNGYDETSNPNAEPNNYDYYYVPEYQLMPFTSDNQIIMDPRYIKLIKEKAEIIDVDTIKIGTFFFYEGVAPEYNIPNTPEKTYIFEGESLSPVPGSEYLDDVVSGQLNYRNARGINIYINGNLIDNSLILDYNMSGGLIKLNRVLNIDDEVRVTYLNKIDGFLCPYPRIDRDLAEHNSYRIYIRAKYPNYNLLWPADEPERLCYRKLEDGVPDVIMRSCLTDEEVDKNGIYYVPFNGTEHPHYNIADVTMIEAITIEDARVYGGGITEEAQSEFPFAQSYLDIMNANGLRIPQAVTFIKIPSALVNNLVDEYISEGKTKNEAIDFLKRHIEKHIGLGVFYVLVDENDNLYEQPFPKMEDK